MCGFAGIIDFKKVLTNEQKHLQQMTNVATKLILMSSLDTED